ncbi:MAG: phosphatidate cytidylyltransferase [Propionibacteriaceae bacterium]|jgi:phosphatidate cytidylyltransferase|nr:phosphatidate cytidylyltransferase [Propionibacteriaceae bacterium]
MSDSDKPVDPAQGEPWPLENPDPSDKVHDRHHEHPHDHHEHPHDDHPHSPAEVAKVLEQHLDEVSQHAKELGDEINRKAGRNLLASIVVGAVLLAALGSSLFFFPWAFVAIIGVGLVIAEVEVARAIKGARGWKVTFVPLVIGSVALLCGAYGIQQWGFMDANLWVLGCLGLTTLAVLLVRMLGPIEGYVADVASSLFLLAYLPLLGSAVMFILASPEGSDKIVVFIATIAASDTGGYLMGLALGKHKMAPRLSPKKSWEGMAGSFILAGVAAILMVVLWLNEPWWKALILAFSLVIIGTVGDLVESIIKRDLGIKDMGSILPGHGGVMDRVDSYLVAAFPAWILMAWLFPHV